MFRWRCSVCEYIYDPRKGDPESGLGPGILFEKLPDYWGCPDCGAAKEMFERIEEYEDEYG